MPVTFSVGGSISEAGRLVLDHPESFRRLVARMGHGLRVVVTIAEEHETRPKWLNRFYWGLIIGPTAEHCGYTKDEMHEAWKWEFLRLEDPDHPMPTVRSTTDLTPQEMREYIENIRIAAAVRWGVQLPEINEANQGVGTDPSPPARTSSQNRICQKCGGPLVFPGPICMNCQLAEHLATEGGGRSNGAP